MSVPSCKHAPRFATHRPIRLMTSPAATVALFAVLIAEVRGLHRRGNRRTPPGSSAERTGASSNRAPSYRPGAARDRWRAERRHAVLIDEPDRKSDRRVGLPDDPARHL